jgi:hypothetical protein
VIFGRFQVVVNYIFALTCAMALHAHAFALEIKCPAKVKLKTVVVDQSPDWIKIDTDKVLLLSSGRPLIEWAGKEVQMKPEGIGTELVWPLRMQPSKEAAIYLVCEYGSSGGMEIRRRLSGSFAGTCRSGRSLDGLAYAICKTD